MSYKTKQIIETESKQVKIAKLMKELSETDQMIVILSLSRQLKTVNQDTLMRIMQDRLNKQN